MLQHYYIVIKNRVDISNRLLDSLLKEAMKKDYISVEKYLTENGYDKRMAKGIRIKLINDGNAVLINDDEYSMKISTNGLLFIKDGGYTMKNIKEYIPQITALIGCITGLISFLWHVVSLFLE